MLSSSSTPKIDPLATDWWNYLAWAGTRSPPGLRVRSPNGDTQCTKQCCRQAKQPACSKSKWLAQMQPNPMPKWGGSSLLYSVGLSQNPKAHLLQRSLSLTTCSSPSAQSLQVSMWAPFSMWSFGPLGFPFKLQRCATREWLYSKSKLCPPFLTFLFINNYRRQNWTKSNIPISHG